MSDDSKSAVSAQLAAAEGPPSSDKQTTGLKLVTVAPGSVSIPDSEVAAYAPSSTDGDRPSRPLPERKDDPFLGCTIDGRYKVEDILGEGGMGVVYRCRHKIIDKKVAMKILRADLARDKEVTERFLVEAKAASAIGNEHIIDISDFGQLPDGSTYFVMEFLEGQPLSAVVEQDKPMPVSRIVHIAKQLAEGLAHAHDAGIVHRDLKPDNIFLITRGKDPDFVKILDFGIAKVSTSEQGITRAGAVFGTPHYMSPEQAAGAPIDRRGDIYSLGVILYELASGKVPFDADNFMGILTQHMYKAPVPIRALVPAPQEIPPGLEAIVLKCLSKRAEQRYQNMAELLEDLSKLTEGNIPDAVAEMMQRSGGFNVPQDYFKKTGMPEPMPAQPVGVPRSKWPMYAGIAGVLAAVVIVVGIFAVGGNSDAASEQPQPQPQPPTTPAAAATTTNDNEPAVVPAEEAGEAAMNLTTQVVIAMTPLEARIFHKEKDLGSSPVIVQVPEGETWDLTVKADGYKDEVLKVDGSSPRMSVQLERTKRVLKGGPIQAPKPTSKPTPKATPRPRPKPQPKIGGSDIVNPWN